MEMTQVLFMQAVENVSHIIRRLRSLSEVFGTELTIALALEAGYGTVERLGFPRVGMVLGDHMISPALRLPELSEYPIAMQVVDTLVRASHLLPEAQAALDTVLGGFNGAQ